VGDEFLFSPISFWESIKLQVFRANGWGQTLCYVWRFTWLTL